MKCPDTVPGAWGVYKIQYFGGSILMLSILRSVLPMLVIVFLCYTVLAYTGSNEFGFLRHLNILNKIISVLLVIDTLVTYRFQKPDLLAKAKSLNLLCVFGVVRVTSVSCH